MIYFKNPGLIPIQAITTMGVNVKEFAGATGHFGTGLKIAVASILRTGGSIVIYRGMLRITFETVREDVRGKPFEFVEMIENYATKNRMNKRQRLGMTTELGKNWEPWMIMRELESNCRDEQGKSSLEQQFPQEDTTLIVVNSQLIENEYNRRELYFIDDEPIYQHPKFDIHKGETDKFFYHGIFVGIFDQKIPFKVNVRKDLTRHLTEDRTMNAYYVKDILESYIPEITDARIIERLFPDEYTSTALIHQMDFNQRWTDPSEAFFSRMKYLNTVNFLCVPQSVVPLMIHHQQFDKYERRKIIDMDVMEEMMLARAKQYLTDLGYSDVDEYPIKKCNLGPEIHALADGFTRTIFLSPGVFDMGQKFVCSTLHEEFLHLHYHLPDCSSGLQQHLFDRLATIMEKHFYKAPI